jgi:hypothetical protein
VAESGVTLTPKRRFAQFLILKPAVVEIDGNAVGEARWGGPQIFVADPGSHQLTVSFRYFWMKRAGEASITIEVPADQTVDVLYRSPWFVTNKGSLTRV